ncbi:PREDICTED: olfactory receptor 4P4-like [Myotis davidii]|uniref:olfactory receptor 4P4-like n=1 Tax=Myotis davidii TaxID=225400 RepID=UPI0003EBE801|nr:PREDICTED: olfactory receptor 4P4-like [Myotis davidii]
MIEGQRSYYTKNCISKIFFFIFMGITEFYLLTAMAYDRYVAICRPLYYMVIMSRKACYVLVMASVIGGFIHSILHVLIIVQLPFCGPNQIDHYFCDVFPLLKLACTDTSLLIIAIITTTGVLSILTFVALVISYIIILSTLRTRSSEGCRKALSTCGSHITVVFMFFLPLIFTYVPTADSVNKDKVFALFYTMIAPMFNPLIYTLRNTDMKNAMRKVWCRDKLLEGK